MKEYPTETPGLETSFSSDSFPPEPTGDDEWQPVPIIHRDTSQPMWIVVTGAHGAGKSTFIRTVCDEEIWWDISAVKQVYPRTPSEIADAERTAAYARCGRLQVDDDLIVHFLDMPGIRRFDFLWKIPRQQLFGFVLVVDSTLPSTFREARSLVRTFHTYSIAPFVVAANRQFDPTAWSVNDIYIALGLREFFPRNATHGTVIPCEAIEPGDVKFLLVQLLYKSIALLEYDDYPNE